MWKRNFLFRAEEATPLQETENELFDEVDQALDSSGLDMMDKFISVWVQGDGEDETPTAYTNVYVRTATFDTHKQKGFLQPLQGRAHQIKSLLTPDQKAYLKDWLKTTSPLAWKESGDHFQDIFEED